MLRPQQGCLCQLRRVYSHGLYHLAHFRHAAQWSCSTEVYNLTTGQVGIAPQGLPHYMANLGCGTVNFTQGFSNRDPGTVTLSNALSK